MISIWAKGNDFYEFRSRACFTLSFEDHCDVLSELSSFSFCVDGIGFEFKARCIFELICPFIVENSSSFHAELVEAFQLIFVKWGY